MGGVAWRGWEDGGIVHVIMYSAYWLDAKAGGRRGVRAEENEAVLGSLGHQKKKKTYHDFQPTHPPSCLLFIVIFRAGHKKEKSLVKLCTYHT